jgi:hypothetical protein
VNKKANTKSDVKLIGVSDGKLRAYLHEYSFLKDYLPAVVIDLKTSRVNENLLLRKTGTVRERIIFINSFGFYVGEVGVKHFPASKRTWKNWFPKPSYDVEIEHEAVYQAVLRLEKENEKELFSHHPALMVNYIVTIFGGKVTVYKPPKLDEWEMYKSPDPPSPQDKLLFMAEIARIRQNEKENVLDKDDEFEKEVAGIRSA